MKLTSPFRLTFARRPIAGRGVTRRSPRAAVAWFVVAFLLLNLAAFVAVDVVRPGLRDPEYGRRVSRLKARVAENPTRPAVVVIGSSRTSMGVCPAAWEAVSLPSAPILFNLSVAGSGPILERLTLRRMLADGVRPAVVLFEFWPPFMRQDGDYSELARLDPLRLSNRDRAHSPELTTGPTKRWNPIGGNRHRWLVQLVPSWLPPAKRLDVNWSQLDPWGWLPGLDETDGDRAARLPHSEAYYRPALAGCAIDPRSDEALRGAVALAKAHGAAVGFVWLPESSEFRGWYPPDVERRHREYVTALCAELGAPLIDARTWAADHRLTDGFHLSLAGAAEFTRKLGPAVASAFPGVGCKP